MSESVTTPNPVPTETVYEGDLVEINDNLIYVCHPSYASPVPYAAKQFWTAHTKAGSKWRGHLRLVSNGGSLLANTFNQFWADALNRQVDGEDIKFFVMLHDDVVPAEGWVDQLLHDLIESNADLTAAVVPIKDYRGLTSTAIDDPADPFKPARRLTMREVYTLPEVFTAEDTGHGDRFLLANTGCWACRFDRPWRLAENADGTLKLFFTINDEIRRGPDGKWQARVEPEDWNFSRRLGALGGRVTVTRRVELAHWGMIPFSNKHGDWGEWTFDRSTCDGPIDPPVPLTSNRIDRFSNRRKRFLDVHGWLSDAEGSKLAGLASDKHVLEIGSFCGLSTIWMARTAATVTAVDPHDGREQASGGKSTLEEFRKNLFSYGVDDRVNVIPGTSADVLPNLDNMYDMAFVDGDHTVEGVRLDIELVSKRVKPGGIVAFHDYMSPSDPGVTPAVNEAVAAGRLTVLDRVDSLLVTRLEVTDNG